MAYRGPEDRCNYANQHVHLYGFHLNGSREDEKLTGRSKYSLLNASCYCIKTPALLCVFNFANANIGCFTGSNRVCNTHITLDVYPGVVLKHLLFCVILRDFHKIFLIYFYSRIHTQTACSNLDQGPKLFLYLHRQTDSR